MWERGTVFVLVDSERIVKAERALGMSIQKIRLFLQFSRRSPIIITVQRSDVLPLRQRKGLSKDPVAAGSQGFLRQYETDFPGILALKIKDNGARPVDGAILSDNDFVLAICLLHQNTIERLRNIFFMIVGRNQDTYFHCG